MLVRRLGFLHIAAVAGLAGLGAFAAFERGGRQDAQAADREPRPAAEIVARGRIEPRDGVIAVSGPPESLSTVAIVDKLMVAQGAKVSAGQVLAVLNGYELSRADHDVMLANLRVARLQRAQLLAGVGKVAEIAAQANVLEARRAQLVRHEKEWGRVSMLVERNAMSIQSLDIQRAALAQITQEVEQAQNALKALSEVRPVDAALSEGLVAVAEANVVKAQASMERLQIRARAPGTVLSIQTRNGEVVGGDGILRLGDLDHLVVMAEVDEAQIGRVRPGMTAQIGGKLLPEPLSARVTRVANEINRQKRPSSDILVGRDARIVEVELTPERPLPAVVGGEVVVQFFASAGER